MEIWMTICMVGIPVLMVVIWATILFYMMVRWVPRTPPLPTPPIPEGWKVEYEGVPKKGDYYIDSNVSAERFFVNDVQRLLDAIDGAAEEYVDESIVDEAKHLRAVWSNRLERT